MYNKRQYHKTNNKKILHKIGKKWAVISMGVMILLTGATILNGRLTHASEIHNQRPVAVKQLNNSQSQRALGIKSKGFAHKAPNNRINSINLRRIHQKARALHQRIVNNAVKNNLHVTQTKMNLKHRTTLMISKPEINQSHHTVTLSRYARKHSYRSGHHKHYRYHHSSYHNYGRLWLNPNRHGEVNGIPHGKLGYFTSAKGDDYPDNFSELYIKPEHLKIVGKDKVNGYKFYRSRAPYESKTYWFLATDFSHHKHHKTNNKRFHKFLVVTDHRFLRKHFNRTDRGQIYRVRHRFFYLMHHENSANATRNMASFRKHVVDWINFYRCYIYDENPVYENSDFDETAQNGADTQSDPEDMNWGDDNPYQIVRSYITDAADADHDGKTGHRDSVLNPAAGNVGVGQNSDVNALYFDFGDSYSYSDDQNIDYPRISNFPIDLAVDGEYWSMQSDALGNSSGDTVEAYDITNGHHRRLGAYACTLLGNSTYFKVPTRKLHTGHTYKVVLNCDDYSTPYWYTFTLYDLDPYSGDIMNV